jgi:hypothetical protein
MARQDTLTVKLELINQRCISFTIIFAFFINDLVSYMKTYYRNGIFISRDVQDIHSLMFADGVATVADTVANQQDHINCMAEFSSFMGNVVYLDYCKIMVFRNGGPVRLNENGIIVNEK